LTGRLRRPGEYDSANHPRRLVSPRLVGGLDEHVIQRLGPSRGHRDTAVVGHLPTPTFIGTVALGAVVYRRAFLNAVHASTVCAGLVAVLCCLGYAAFGPTIVALIMGISEIRAMAGEFLPWLAIAPIVSVWSFQLDGIFSGTTRTVAMRNAMLLSLAAFLIAVWLFLPLWAALMVLMVTWAITLGIWYPRIVRNLPES